VRSPGSMIWMTSVMTAGYWQSGTYVGRLIDKAKAAQDAGKIDEALVLGWKAARIGERSRAGAVTDVDFLRADHLLQPVYKFLQPLEAAAGHRQEADFLTVQNELMQRQFNSTIYHYQDVDLHEATSFALHAAAFGIVIFGGGLGISLVFLLIARFAPAIRERGSYRWACNIARFAPAGFGAAIVLMAASFAPFLAGMHAYLRGENSDVTMKQIFSVWNSLYVAPQIMFGSSYGAQLHVLFWEGLLVVCFALGAAACIAAARDRWQKMRVA
jgi:hypothetical protein